jgi:hypothetical protein
MAATTASWSTLNKSLLQRSALPDRLDERAGLTGQQLTTLFA